MSEKATWWYYLPEQGEAVEDATSLEVGKYAEATHVAARAHEESDNGEWTKKEVVYVSKDRLNWVRCESYAEPTIYYKAYRVKEPEGGDQ